MVELDLVSGMLLTNRIQQKWQNDSVARLPKTVISSCSILYWLFSHSGSDGEGNWGQGTEGRFWPMASGNGGPQAHSPKGIESWPPPLRELGRRFCVSWSCTPGKVTWSPVSILIEALWVRWPFILVCLGTRDFLGCGTFSFKTRKVLGKLGWVGHPACKRLWARRSTEVEIINVTCFKAVNLGGNLSCSSGKLIHLYSGFNSGINSQRKSLSLGCLPRGPSSNLLQYSVLFPMRASEMLSCLGPLGFSFSSARLQTLC